MDPLGALHFVSIESNYNTESRQGRRQMSYALSAAEDGRAW